MTLELQATPEEVMRAVEAVQSFGREQQLPEKEIFGLALAVEECGSNIVEHAYRRDPRQKFRVTFLYTGSSVVIELRDCGPAFDPTTLMARATTLAPEDERPPGGWGIPLVRHYMDEIRYQREAGENVLQLTKRLNSTKSSPL